MPKADGLVYGVIAEWKEEGPLVMESKLMDWETANARMRGMAADERVIRVAMFRAVYETGNESLLPKEEKP